MTRFPDRIYPDGPDWYIKVEDLPLPLSQDDPEFLDAYKRGTEDWNEKFPIWQEWYETPRKSRGPEPENPGFSERNAIARLLGLGDAGALIIKLWEHWIDIKTGHHPSEWVRSPQCCREGHIWVELPTTDPRYDRSPRYSDRALCERCDVVRFTSV